MKNSSLVSIITCTYNSGKFLGRIYESLLNQSDKNFEWIIVDDFSSDTTVEQLSKLESPGLGGVKIYSMPFNSGGGAAGCIGILKSVGDIISVIDHDDEMAPEAIHKIRFKFNNIFEKSHIAGILFRSIQSNNKKKISSLKDKEIFKVSYFMNKETESVDGVWALKGDIARHYYSLNEASKYVLGSVALLKISQKYYFEFADGEPILIYHRDNNNSQSNDLRISNLMIHNFSQVLNYHDKYYYSHPLKWIRYSIGLIHFSLIFYGTPFNLISMVSRRSTKIWLLLLIPVGCVAHYFKKKGKVVKYKEIDLKDLIDKIQEIKVLKIKNL